jgi:hypothetical protein
MDKLKKPKIMPIEHTTKEINLMKKLTDLT